MLQEFKKINNPRQQRKYLDKQALALAKTEMNEQKMNQVLELSEYLDSIHFWQKYDSLFDETISMAKAMKLQKEVEERMNSLSSKEKEQFQNNVKIMAAYEKDIVIDSFDASKKPIRSILLKGSTSVDRFASLQEMKTLLLDVMECKGSLEIHYFNGRRILKRIKL